MAGSRVLFFFSLYIKVFFFFLNRHYERYETSKTIEEHPGQSLSDRYVILDFGIYVILLFLCQEVLKLPINFSQLSVYHASLLCFAGFFMSCFCIEKTSSQTFGKLYAVL